MTRSAARPGRARSGPRRRDRRGRGLRSPLYPATSPAARTRAERFDAVVLEALEPLEERWSAELTDLDVAVDDVPDVAELSTDSELDEGVVGDGEIPLARLVPAGVDRRGRTTRARIVVYRRPLEARALDGEDLADLLHDVLVEQIAGYLGVEPDTIAGEE